MFVLSGGEHFIPQDSSSEGNSICRTRQALSLWLILAFIIIPSQFFVCRKISIDIIIMLKGRKEGGKEGGRGEREGGKEGGRRKERGRKKKGERGPFPLPGTPFCLLPHSLSHFPQPSYH